MPMKAQHSPYIHTVFEYQPAPGQFVNELPEYAEGDTAEDMCRKAEESIANNHRGLVTLGGYGGYIVFGFDHAVQNIPGEYDFKILGNSMYSSGGLTNGGSEPGIVLVSHDDNGNGLPDDEWYELAGSEYDSPATVHNYAVTYYRPTPDHVPTPDPDLSFLNDTSYIKWQDNQGVTGHIAKNTFHTQPYYPQWAEGDSLQFEGSRLADNFVVNQGQYVLYAYDRGYADNHANGQEGSNFKIDWAVDSKGQPVRLDAIHFVKVYTAVNQYCGRLGESSTEVMGAEDLHLTTGVQTAYHDEIRAGFFQSGERLLLAVPCDGTAEIYPIAGNLLHRITVQAGVNEVNCSDWPRGVYVVRVNGKTMKLVK